MGGEEGEGMRKLATLQGSYCSDFGSCWGVVVIPQAESGPSDMLYALLSQI